MKIYIFIILLFNFFLINLYAGEKKNCSNFKKLSKEYLKCKTVNFSKNNFLKNIIEYQKKAFATKNKSD